LKAEAELVHSAGAKYGYIVTSNTMPLLEQYAKAGVDVLIGVDPHDWDLGQAKQQLKNKVCLWGGVNGQKTIERGSEKTVRSEVQKAFEILSPDGGFILSPVDNVRHHDYISRENVDVLIDEWKKNCRTEI